MGGWKAGTGSAIFTPDEAMWLAGWAVRTEPAREKISDLMATALAVEDARGRKLVLISADIIAIPRALADAAALKIQALHPGMARQNFIFAASHTHCGPEIRGDKALFFNIPEEYAAKIPRAASMLVDAMARAAIDALDRMEPARLYWHRTRAGFAHNRRPQGDFFDHEVPVLLAKSANGKPAAAVFGYACHNLTLDPHDLRYCAEWSGVAREFLERWNPGMKGLFVTGCAGDQNPEPRGKLEEMQAHGKELAEAVQKCLQDRGSEIEPDMAIETEEVEFEMKPVSAEWIEEGLVSEDKPRRVKARYLKERLDRGEKLETSYRGPFQVVRLGKQVLMIVLSGEPVVEWAHRFKNEFKFPLVWVAGYCNDMYGYLPTRSVQEQGGYEGGRANLWSSLPGPWTEDVEERISAAVRRLVTKVS